MALGRFASWLSTMMLLGCAQGNDGDQSSVADNGATLTGTGTTTITTMPGTGTTAGPASMASSEGTGPSSGGASSTSTGGADVTTSSAGGADVTSSSGQTNASAATTTSAGGADVTTSSGQTNASTATTTTASGGGGSGGSGGSDGVTGAGGTWSAADCEGATLLREAARCTGRRIGVALKAQYLSEQAYAERAREFDYVTAEDEMKWDATEPSPGQFTFTQGDQIVEFARANDMLVKGHTLVWHNQLPSWLTSMNDANAIRQAMLDHIEGVATYYRGKVIAWDVVNEAYEDDGQLRSSIWSQHLGSSFIEDAFVAARAADPDAKLYYNDYDIESAYAKADAVYEMVRDLVERGIPIDGVGMQMHTRTADEDPPIPEFEANLRRIVELGLEVVLSEMDVRLCADGTFEKQKTRYHDIMEVCLAEPRCTAITIWGITDQYSFLNARTDLQCQGSEPPRPLLWDDDYEKKPAYDGVMDALLGR
jgi:endo-1,4-beta-xylanase